MERWHSMDFLRTADAYSKSRSMQLIPIVLPKSFLEALNRNLVWIFAELIVIEALLNAPGLAYKLWQYTKNQQIVSFLQTGFFLIAIFIVINFTSILFQKRLGKRLAGYH